MRKILIVSILLLTVFLTGCGSDTPTWVDKVGKLSVTEMDTRMDSYYPAFYGKVKNTGNCTVYNVMISFKIYETADKNTIIGTAQDYIINGNDIKKGETATFEAASIGLDSVDDLQYYSYEITFLER